MVSTAKKVNKILQKREEAGDLRMRLEGLLMATSGELPDQATRILRMHLVSDKRTITIYLLTSAWIP